MEKAFDPKDLVARLRLHGITIADEAAHAVINDIFNWVKDSVAVIGGPATEFVLPIAQKLHDLAVAEVDKLIAPVSAP